MSKPDNLDRTEAKLVQASFSSWKLDMMKAMAFDPNLHASDVRVAFALLHHLNGATWLLYPSQQTLSDLTHMTVRNVITCLGRLQASGWLHWRRGNRQKSNEYEFIADNLPAALARLKEQEMDRRRGRTRSKKPIPDMNYSSHQKTGPTCTPLHVATCTPVHPNTLREQIHPPRKAGK
ncbi:winged helix-turn-helix domain-containing protein [Devosia sp. 1635]|uniref:winged helix-turn-helix domain-containing protein n=1 Tax=Devosia sp. 1635 TaxID=2726066 RepID=UPI001565D275|nr:winged helix-turn-helix domain-containing protein [Devosia sp. 1635]